MKIDRWMYIQVNLCQKLLFLHQLTHNMFIELQVQYMKIQSSNLGRICWVQKLFMTFRTIFVHNSCSPHVLQNVERLTKIYLYQRLQPANFWHFGTWAYIWTVRSYRIGSKFFSSRTIDFCLQRMQFQPVIVQEFIFR